MHLHFLDPFRPRNSPVHQLDPRVKFVLTVAFILTTALTPAGAWPIYILLFALIVSVEILSELGVRYVLTRAVLAFSFVLAAIPVMFTMESAPVFIITISPWELIASLQRVIRFASIALKSWISVQAAIVLAASTPFPDLLVAMRAVRIPHLLVAVFGLMWRYLFVFVDEAMRLMRARASRSGHSDQPKLKRGGSLSWRARVVGGMAGNLFVRALERTDRIYMAMVSRGYDGEVRTIPLPELNVVNRLVLGIGLVALVSLLALSLLIGG